MSLFTGGDEIGAIVIDIGNRTTKAGYAGEDNPKAVFPSYVGVVRTEDSNAMSDENEEQKSSKKEYFVGTQALSFPREHMEVESPFNAQTGLIDNWDLTEKIIDHALNDRLGVNTSEHPVMMAEPSYNSKLNREKMATLLFEKFQSPAIFLSKSPVLSAFAMAKYTALVVDCGASGTCVTPVVDGYVLTKGVVRNFYGGNAISNNILSLLEKERGSPVKPNYMIKRERLSQGKFKLHETNYPNVTESYKQYSLMNQNVANEIKESLFRVPENPFTESEINSTPKMNFEINDGTSVNIAADRFSIPETLFKPSALLGQQPQLLYDQQSSHPHPSPSDPQGEILDNITALHQLAYESIMRCDPDVRKDLFACTVLTGGTTLFPGLTKRFEKELTARAPSNMRVKAPLAAASLPTERKFSVWIGGSILASLGTFQPMWISKKDYDEVGVAIVHREAP